MTTILQSARTVPNPRRLLIGCECNYRADADDSMPGNVKPGLVLYSFGSYKAKNCDRASKEAKRSAIQTLQMKPKHVKCRCAGEGDEPFEKRGIDPGQSGGSYKGAARSAQRIAPSSLLKKASDPVIAGAAKDFSSPKANKKRDSISYRYPE
jgi:hypothetical protein